MAQSNVFVIGLEDANLEELQSVPGADELRFRRLLDPDNLIELENLDLPAQLDEARRTLEEFDGSIDAIVGYWDFPVTSLVAILCEEFGLPGLRLEGVVRAEHKYWSRLLQAEVIDDYPGFGVVALDDEEESPVPPEGVEFPMWVKPVKGVSSQLAFKAENKSEFARAVAQIREEIDTFSEPFALVLDRVPLPEEVTGANGRACVVEEAATGRQFTVEGYCIDDVPEVYGVIETVLYEGRPNFQRYEYPAAIPQEVEDRLISDSVAVMNRIGIGFGTFNIEYFWDPETDRIRLLEVNPRHSQSHADIVRLVDGAPNHHAAIEIALGKEPSMPRRSGPYSVAGKFFLRSFTEDGVVTAAPDADDVARLEERFPGVQITPAVTTGMRLSELEHQDPYSWVLADIVIGAEDVDQMAARYDACVDALGFVVEGTGGEEASSA